MPMQVIKLNPKKFENFKIDQIVKCLKVNKIVVLPTDTCYGIMAKAIDKRAVWQVFEMKKRPLTHPLSCIFCDLAMIKKYAKIDAVNERLIRKFLPGAMTFLLPVLSKKKLPEILLSEAKYIGARIPKNKLIAAVMQKIDFPITATSANVSGMPEPYSTNEVITQFKDEKLQPDLIVDAGKLKRTKPSTVVKIENSKVKILREGPISQKQILEALCD